MPCVFRARLEIVRSLDFRTGDRGCFVGWRRDQQRPWKADAGVDAEFIRSQIILGLELEGSLEADIEPFSTVEQILVIKIQLRGDAYKTG